MEGASWVEQRERLQALAASIEPSVRVQTKDGRVWRLLGTLAGIATFGAIPRAVFLERYATALGPLQGYPRGWSIERVEQSIVHEARHTWQARMCGLGIHPWLGLPLFGLLYLGLPLPTGLALARLLFELDADRAAWRHRLAAGCDPDEVRARAREFAGVVCSGHYAWSLPRAWGERIFERAAERTIARHARRDGSTGREPHAQRASGADPTDR